MSRTCQRGRQVPDAATTVIFGKLPQSLPDISIPGPDGPSEVRRLPSFVTGQTMDHTRYSYQLNDSTVRHWSLHFPNLTTADHTTLEDLYHIYLKGSAESFTYQHTDGEVYTEVRWIDPEFRSTRLNDSTWSLDITLELTDQIDNPARVVP